MLNVSGHNYVDKLGVKPGQLSLDANTLIKSLNKLRIHPHLSHPLSGHLPSSLVQKFVQLLSQNSQLSPQSTGTIMTTTTILNLYNIKTGGGEI